MAGYIRRLVSGEKARFKDGELNVELDLVYLTDQIIVMGYPAAGLESLYRNHQNHVKKFLDHRHGKNYWIFNFCPIRENSYEPDFFYGRVTRYPFPDHHVPPLAVMPLLAREMRTWFKDSPDRIAVLHCKAGKGRSGTMACAYLLSLDDRPTLPNLERSYSTQHWAKMRADDMMQVGSEEVDGNLLKNAPLTLDQGTPVFDSVDLLSHADIAAVSAAKSTKSFADSLKDVLDLHTSRRMKVSSASGKKVKQGVSIPSQRRYLHYWALLLTRNDAPVHFWAISHSPGNPKIPKVRLTQIVLRIWEASVVTTNLVRAASFVMNLTNIGKKSVHNEGNRKGHVWVSLARYEDKLVELLETWEQHTRDENHMSWRRPGSEHMGDIKLNREFEDGKWDKEKMVRSFAGLSAVDAAIVKSDDNKGTNIFAYTMRPFTDKKRDEPRGNLQHTETGETLNPAEANPPSLDGGVVLDAAREVRIKLYMGQALMGWLWIIPAFHMPAPSACAEQLKTTRLVLPRREIDFPIGVGSAIVDVEISLEWFRETDAGRDSLLS